MRLRLQRSSVETVKREACTDIHVSRRARRGKRVTSSSLLLRFLRVKLAGLDLFRFCSSHLLVLSFRRQVEYISRSLAHGPTEEITLWPCRIWSFCGKNGRPYTP
jgi:hypothetical protein